FTTKVNANECLISDKENGFFLQGDINSDTFNILSIINNSDLRNKIRLNIYNDLMMKYIPIKVINEIKVDDYR
ncbi:hypothetical protein ACYOA9_005088, partial [Escherichia coli]